MNTLEECRPGIWGSAECLARLETAESAKLLLVSDTHGRLSLLRGILARYGASCDALVFAGDGVSDLIECREEALIEEKACAILPPLIALVAGNCDLPVYRVTSEKNRAEHVFFRMPLAQVLTVCGQRLLVAHGHLLSVNFSLDSLVSTAKSNECQIAVYGHTHIASAESYGSVFAVNPGSICQPRGNSTASFAMLNVKAGSRQPECSFFAPGEGVPPLAKKTRERRQK